MSVWWNRCTPPTSPSCRTSTDASTARDTPAPACPARPAVARSRSTSRVAAWGNRDVRARPAADRGRVRGLPLPLATPGDSRPAPLRAHAVGPRNRTHQHPGERREVTTCSSGDAVHLQRPVLGLVLGLVFRLVFCPGTAAGG